MKIAIENLKSKYDSGLLLIDYPTGVGKTFDSIKYISEHRDNTIFFITPLKKNLYDAYEELRKQSDKDWFNKNAMILKSNFDYIESKLLDIRENDDEIVNMKSFVTLKTSLISYKSNQNNSVLKEVVSKEECKFRNDVEKYLLTKGKTKKERLSFVKLNHKWLLDLYPSILSEEKKIFFMTVDKFLAGNSTIISPTYKFIDSKLIRKSIIFIDEIDSTKKRVLDFINQEYLDNKFDLFKVFNNARDRLHKKFPDRLFVPNNKSDKDADSYKDILEKNKNLFDRTAEEYNLDYFFKIKSDNKKLNSIFNDTTYLNISEDKYKKIFLESNDKDGYNYISYEKNDSKTRNFNSMLGAVKGAVNYLINGLSILSINYYNTVKDLGDFEIQEAVRQVLEMLGIDDQHLMIRILRNINNTTVQKVSKNSQMIDTDFYNSGFRFFEFNEHITSALQTKIDYYEISETPELYLITLAAKAYVVGLSATGTLPTVLTNYDLNYIKYKLQDRFYELTEEDKKRFHERILSALERNKAIVNIVPINPENTLCTLFDDDEVGLYLEGIIDSKYEEENSFSYRKTKMISILKCINKFVFNSDKKSLLILSNRNIKNDNSIFSLDILNKYFDSAKIDKKEVSNIVYHVFDSNNFSEIKENYVKDIKEGKRVILISSYQTVGVGQNLHYSIEDVKYDIDAIYLEKPTNLLVDSNRFNKESHIELLTYIYQNEALYTNGELTKEELNNSVCSGFYKKNGISKFIKNKSYDSDSLQYAALSILIQAVGRICRTHEIIQEKDIYVDYEIFTSLDFPKVEARELNHEFKEIIKIQKKLNIRVESMTRDKKLIKAQNNNKEISYKLRNDSKTSWNEEKILHWKNLRSFVLKYPTISYEELKNYPQYENLYVEFDKEQEKYSYNQSHDYMNVEISIDEKEFNNIVSEKDCRLDILMKNSSLDFLFSQRGYAKTFKSNKYIMLPVIYNNIYKGALGEVCGKQILANYGINLSEINELKDYEKFDYLYNNYYIDFKYWKNNDIDLDLDKFEQKLDKVGGDKALIINILGTEDYINYYANKIRVIPSLINETTGTIINKNINVVLNELGGKGNGFN